MGRVEVIGWEDFPVCGVRLIIAGCHLQATADSTEETLLKSFALWMDSQHNFFYLNNEPKPI